MVATVRNLKNKVDLISAMPRVLGFPSNTDTKIIKEY